MEMMDEEIWSNLREEEEEDGQKRKRKRKDRAGQQRRLDEARRKRLRV